jgi:hypothetical protein
MVVVCGLMKSGARALLVHEQIVAASRRVATEVVLAAAGEVS